MVSYEHWLEARVLRRIRLGTRHQPTGRVKHFRDSQLLPQPSELVIARHDAMTRSDITESPRPSASYYTFYLDSSGGEMTDMCEQTLADALAQAEAEFGIQPDDWDVIDQDEP